MADDQAITSLMPWGPGWNKQMGLQLHNFEPVPWAMGYHVEQKIIEVKTYMLWSFVLTSSTFGSRVF